MRNLITNKEKRKISQYMSEIKDHSKKKIKIKIVEIECYLEKNKKNEINFKIKKVSKLF